MAPAAVLAHTCAELSGHLGSMNGGTAAPADSAEMPRATHGPPVLPTANPAPPRAANNPASQTHLEHLRLIKQIAANLSTAVDLLLQHYSSTLQPPDDAAAASHGSHGASASSVDTPGGGGAGQVD